MTLYLANIHGDFKSGAEQFQHSLAISDDGVSSQSNLADTFAADVDQAFTSSDLMSQLSSMWRYTHITIAEVLSQAPVRLAAATTKALPTVRAGTSSNRTLPPQCAVVVSLIADPYANGTPVKGRMFMPPPGGGLGMMDDGSLITSVQDHYGAFAADLCGAVNNVDELRFAAVWSRQGPGKGDGTAHKIQHIKIGNVVDTVRSRRSALKETYKEYSFSSV